MRILQISPQVPFPLDSGGRIGIYGIASYLAKRGNSIDFVAYKKNIDFEFANKKLSEFATPHILDVNTDNNLFGAIKNLFSHVPYNISKFNTSQLEIFLRNFFANSDVDLVHIDHLHMGWIVDIVRQLSNAPVVLREHNLELKIMQRFYESQTNPILKKYAKIQYKKFRKYEPYLCEKFDKCIMVSPNDEIELLKLNPKIKTTTISVGVEQKLLNVQKENIIPYSIFHLGSLNWLPNLEGLRMVFKRGLPCNRKKTTICNIIYLW